jgi:hypothetical protein
MTTATGRKDAAKASRDVMGGDRDQSGNLVDVIPKVRFGKGKARILRKLVMLAIAKSADPDGSNAWPSRETIAHRCLVSVEAVRKVLAWLEKHKLLKIESKAVPTSKFGRTNLYTILFDPPQKNSRAKKCSQMEHAPATIQGSTSNYRQEHQQQCAEAPATIVQTPANRSCHDRPIDRPSVPSSSTAPSTPEPKLQVGGGPRKSPFTVMGRKEFLVEVRKLLKSLWVVGVSAEGIPSHWNEAWEEAQEIGPELFIAALHSCVLDDVRAGYNNVYVCREGTQLEKRKYLLHHLVENGFVREYADKVRPFMHLPPESRLLLVRLADRNCIPPVPTPDEVRELMAWEESIGWHHVLDAVERADGAVAVFLDHPGKYVSPEHMEEFRSDFPDLSAVPNENESASAEAGAIQ